MTWLNQNLIRYSADKHILPDTQVAAQPGVQTRDLMSYLAGIKCWTTRHKQPVYAIKRDQMKGFDRLSPDGFYDALKAYGLPASIVALDKAAQTQVRCFIHTAYGATLPITVSGVNKQGGPASQLKSTFTTSMGHYYLSDILAQDQNALIVTTSSNRRKDPHTPDARLEIQVTMVEATDDTYIFSKSIDSLRRNTLEMERFQYAYGWLTQVDNPTARFNELKDFIDTFQFPKIIGRLPITLLRKITNQNIISKCRALLSLQPITTTDAEKLDKAIIHKVHDALGFPFHPTTDIATLPISQHGFGFLSIARINAALAIDGLSRDLNHHIPAYRDMAKITLADWTCEKNDCQNPLDGPGHGKDQSRRVKSIPSSWVVAHKSMQKLSLSLKVTDQSEITRGDISLSHITNICNHKIPQKSATVNGTTLLTLRRMNIHLLKDIGKWTINGTWASDGSMIPATATLLDPKQITGAATGKSTLVMKVPGRNVSILQGEQVGLIIALVLSGQNDSSNNEQQCLLTDHLNSVHLIHDNQTNISQVPRLQYMNGRSYYRWILSLHERRHIAIEYTPGHADGLTLSSRMNNEADQLATSSGRVVPLYCKLLYSGMR
ncbi:hypothetical protein GALMADRAFT_82330 [Galerina marginata CBS 339.88]|uniref:Uncharacterized protein n=1 Tax=Galerina marginata (strain CBS 339.88) TaxID=685588 RepID=A0A067SBC6_GALM3|nr:hypothetical protein GALMADRAFT_82330 [Galerina marginata CBS 339.88]